MPNLSNEKYNQVSTEKKLAERFSDWMNDYGGDP
jgi:hypothetical protein